MGVLIWILIDLSAISVGTFKDSNGLLLLRRKNCGISEKSNITAILLCTFLGFLGLHRFYLGRSKSGFIILFSSIFILSSVLFNLILIICSIKFIWELRLLVTFVRFTIFIPFSINTPFFSLII